MGNDFEARKRSKKRGKSDIDAEIASEGRYKNKKRRAAVRSICKGMCYNHPECTHLCPDLRSSPMSKAHSPTQARSGIPSSVQSLQLIHHHVVSSPQLIHLG